VKIIITILLAKFSLNTWVEIYKTSQVFVPVFITLGLKKFDIFETKEKFSKQTSLKIGVDYIKNHEAPIFYQ